MDVGDYAARFSEEPGYLDFARFGPVGRAAAEEEAAFGSSVQHARFGSLEPLRTQHDRVRRAVAALTGFRADQVVFQPDTAHGLMHAAFGLTGGIALSAAEHPALTVAVARAAESLKVLIPRFLETDQGRVTPGNLRDQLDPSIACVAVSLVDHRTGYLADLEGIRQVIGDRLLLVDAAQGLGVVDAPFEVADIVVAPGHKWIRAGRGTGILILGDRAIDRLTPVWSGHVAVDPAAEGATGPIPVRGAAAFQIESGDFVAQGRLAAAVEELITVGVAAINARIAVAVSRLIDLADEFAVPVVSPRAEQERAGIVVIEPLPERLTTLTAALHNHGVTATTRDGTVRLSAHASTDDETFSVLRSALLSYSTAH